MSNKDNSRLDSTFNGMRGGDTQPVLVRHSEYPEAVFAKHLEVTVLHNNVDKAIKILRAKVQREKILSSYKEKQEYEKPSDRKRRKRNERARKLLELAAKEEKFGFEE